MRRVFANNAHELPILKASFAPHTVEWTSDKVRRFWDYLSSAPAYENSYFSKQAGDAVLDLVDRKVRLKGRRVLDFGCGPGFLTEKLVARGVWTQAVDTSPRSIESLQRRMQGKTYFGGAFVAGDPDNPIPDATFDVLFFLETIEHLLPEQIDHTLLEVARLTRPGGHVVVTTNNAEDLEADKVICPDCGGIFHRVQHLSSWTPVSLAACMSKYGFERTLTKVTTFRPYSRLTSLLDLVGTLLGSKKINLVYLGRKRW